MTYKECQSEWAKLCKIVRRLAARGEGGDITTVPLLRIDELKGLHSYDFEIQVRGLKIGQDIVNVRKIVAWVIVNTVYAGHMAYEGEPGDPYYGGIMCVGDDGYVLLKRMGQLI